MPPGRGFATPFLDAWTAVPCPNDPREPEGPGAWTAGERRWQLVAVDDFWAWPRPDAPWIAGGGPEPGTGSVARCLAAAPGGAAFFLGGRMTHVGVHDRAALELLADWLDLDAQLVREAVQLCSDGGYLRRRTSAGRALQVPQGVLYTLHARALERVLRCAPISSAAHGGVPGRSIVSHAATHLPHARGLLKMDLAQAYTNLPLEVVSRSLRRCLRPICREMLVDAPTRKRLALLLGRLLTVDGHLPTGGPCSAALLNLACADFDRALERIVAQRLGKDGRYSRYLDDLVVSTRGFDLPRSLIEAIENAVYGFDLGKPNPAKTRFLPSAWGTDREITGIVHDGLGFALSGPRLEKLTARLDAARSGKGNPRAIARGVLNFLGLVYGVDRLPASLAADARALLRGRP